MSPRDTFWFLAGALVAFVIMITARAWLRPPSAKPSATTSASNAPQSLIAFAIPIAAAFALIAVALGIYFLIGSPASLAAAHAPSAAPSPDQTSNDPVAASNPTLLMPGDQWPTDSDAAATGTGGTPSGKPGSANSNAGALDEVTQKLAKRLAASGGTDDEWRLLAQSYDYMGRKNEAQAARAHKVTTDGADTADAAHSAMTVGTGLTATTPSDRATTASPKGAAAAGTDTHAGTPIDASRISGTVQITPTLAASATPGTTLFIYATDPAAPGPPLAVLRLQVDRWPVKFVLDDADAMIPGRNLSGSKSVQLEARISHSGEALPRTGDLVGNVTGVDPHATHAVNISIDHKIG